MVQAGGGIAAHRQHPASQARERHIKGVSCRMPSWAVPSLCCVCMRSTLGVLVACQHAAWLCPLRSAPLLAKPHHDSRHPCSVESALSRSGRLHCCRAARRNACRGKVSKGGRRGAVGSVHRPQLTHGAKAAPSHVDAIKAASLSVFSSCMAHSLTHQYWRLCTAAGAPPPAEACATASTWPCAGPVTGTAAEPGWHRC